MLVTLSKSRVYENKLRTTIELKEEVRGRIAELNAQLCERILQSFEKVNACSRSRGGRMSEVIFNP